MGNQILPPPDDPGSQTELAVNINERAARVAEIQASIIVAKKFPRNEDEAYRKLIRACSRPTFAEEARYEYPRGREKVTGPSVRFAREAARVWGNIEFGIEILEDGEDYVVIRAWAWDKETNARVFTDDEFQKRVQRKSDGGTYWKDVRDDERELRELVNRRGAICVRNCILQLVPADFVEDAMAQVYKTLSDKAAKDPDAERKAVVLGFSQLNISVEDLERYLGHPVAQCSPAEIAGLRSIYVSIRDGNSKWTDYVMTSDVVGANIGTQNQTGAVVRRPANGGKN
jgi:hypothetical protein